MTGYEKILELVKLTYSYSNPAFTPILESIRLIAEANAAGEAGNYIGEVVMTTKLSVERAYPHAKFQVVVMIDGLACHTRIVDTTSAQGGVYLHEFELGNDPADIAHEAVNALAGTRFGRAGAIRK
jgi:hypothetical protein